MSQESLTPRDYVAIVRRRKWFFILPAIFLLAASVVAALLWPPTYRSEATVLIEQPEIPEDLVNTLITDYLERRLEAITRRVTVTDNLLGIIDRYGLYPDARRRLMAIDIVENMRDDIKMEIISTDVVDPQSGRTSPSTVAFTISFDYSDPETAQRVANELVSLYLNENLRQRRQRATETATFLREERERAEQQIVGFERQLSEFKEANNGSLPEQLIFNQQEMARAEQELRDLNRQIQSLQEREAYLQAQLALTEPYQLYTPSGRGSLSPKAQLENMRVELGSLRSRYGADHPDVRRATREVRALEETLGVGPSLASLQRERTDAQANLDSLQQRYTADHPDVQRARRELAAIDAALAKSRGGGSQQSEDRPDNPAYIQLQADLNSVRAELPAVVAQRGHVQERANELQQLVLKTPIVERDYTRLTRQLEELTKLRQNLAEREMTAQLGQNLEVELKGERFSLIEPPLLPTDPVKPNKLLIVLLGVMLSFGGGVGVVTLAHLFDEAIYSAKDIANILGEAPLSVVPRIVTPADRARGFTVRLGTVLTIVGVIGGVLLIIHLTYIPIDILWFGVQRWFTDTLGAILPNSDA